MADLKISALTGASTPLAGTEVLPIVQSGSTKKVSVADLTAGRAVAMAGGSFTDNYTQGTAGKGVNFTANTPAAGMTSQLFNWYEVGAWTATLVSSGGGSVTMTSSAKYIRLGNLVFVSVEAYGVSTTGLSAGNLTITGLPFACSAGSTAIAYFNIAGATSASAGSVVAYASGSTTINLFKSESTSQDVSSLAVSDLNASITIRFNGVYSV